MALVTSRLDYSNSALYGIRKYLMNKLQSAQNNAARLVTKTKKYDRITPILKDLHWLPVESRIMYKILTLVHSSIYSVTCPLYLQDLIVIHAPQRALRSGTDGRLLVVPSTRNCLGVGDRAFSVCGPLLWNSLPLSLRSTKSPLTFKRNLKTHLYNIHYSA